MDRFAAALITILALSLPGIVQAADPGRGKVLYETRCVTCHNTSVHQETSRRVTSFEAVRAQVARWSTQLGTSWDAGDVTDISVYLNDRYYKLPCPSELCSAKTGALGPGNR